MEARTDPILIAATFASRSLRELKDSPALRYAVHDTNRVAEFVASDHAKKRSA
jgi:hypothetical protein